MRLWIDAHLDLAMNVVYYDRSITGPLGAMNAAERGLTDHPFRGRGAVTLPEMRSCGVAVCVATLLARSPPDHPRAPLYRRGDLDYPTREGAYCAAHAQLACYQWLESRGEIRRIATAGELDAHWQRWTAADEEQRRRLPVGVILSMEGADPVLQPADVEYWWEQGVRAIGPAHYGHSHYAAGTGVDGPLTEAGRELLDHMQRLGVALDVTHLSDTSMAEALDRFDGAVWASHHNCRALVPWDRQLTDDQIKQLIARGAVVGMAMDAVMLHAGWVRGKTSPEVLSLDAVVDHIEHICNLAGSADHVGIGTDLDGGYGTEQTPRDLKSIADIQTLAERLSKRGFPAADIDKIYHHNWLDRLRTALPRPRLDDRTPPA